VVGCRAIDILSMELGKRRLALAGNWAICFISPILIIYDNI
jgi:hypothetical protein